MITGISREYTQTPSRGVMALADTEALATLTELIALTARMNEMSVRVHTQLAARPTVNAHLDQARTQLAQLRRAFAHAEGVLAYNAGVRG
jgi:hypothetical protein